MCVCAWLPVLPDTLFLHVHPGFFAGFYGGLIPRGADRDSMLRAVVHLPQTTPGIEWGALASLSNSTSINIPAIGDSFSGVFKLGKLALGADRRSPALHKGAPPPPPPHHPVPPRARITPCLPLVWNANFARAQQFFDDFSTRNSDFAIALSDYSLKDINRWEYEFELKQLRW